MELKTVDKILLAFSFVLSLPPLLALPILAIMLFLPLQTSTPSAPSIGALTGALLYYLRMLGLILFPLLLWLVGVVSYLRLKSKRHTTTILMAIIIIQALYLAFGSAVVALLGF